MFNISSTSSSVGGDNTLPRTLSILQVLVSHFSETASPNLVAGVAFVFVVLQKGYGVGSDNSGEEGVTGWKMFCTDDNGCAISVSLSLDLLYDLLLGDVGGRGGVGGPCENGGGGGIWKFELKLILLFFKASSLDWISMSTGCGG